MVSADEQLADISVSPLELFFDLVFVFAITQVSVLIRHDTSAGNVMRGLLVLAMLWWAWSQYTWTTNAVGTERLSARLVLLLAMGATLFTALAVPDAFDDAGLRFAAGYAAVLLLALTFYWIATGSDTQGRRSAFVTTYLPLAALAGLVFLIGGMFDPGVRTAIWVIGIAVEMLAALKSGQRDFQIRPGHFAERHALFVILALGESIVAVGLAASEVERTLEVTLALGSAFVGTAVLWWAYFDRITEACDRALGDVTGTARTRMARDVFTLGHVPLVLGLVLYAVVAEEAVAHPDEHLGLATRLILAASFALVMVTLAGVGRLAGLPSLWERLVAAGAVAVMALLGGQVVGWVLVMGAAAIVVVALVMERRRLVAHAA